MSNFFSIIIGQKEDKEEKMKTPMFHEEKHKSYQSLLLIRFTYENLCCFKLKLRLYIEGKRKKVPLFAIYFLELVSTYGK